jgi:restriction endonuclease S subunit
MPFLCTPELLLTFVNSLKIPLPKLETQKQIVAQLDQLQIETKKLETIYQQKQLYKFFLIQLLSL